MLIALVALSLWYALTRPGRRRAVAVVFAVAALASATAVVFVGSPVSVAARVVLLVVAGALGRYALARDLRSLKSAATAGTPVPAATQGALIMNLKSGGGKAEQFHLVEECQRRGIEPIVLTRGDDLRDLARDAVDRGADVIGMAGGDGSQALVADVAAERGIPMVVVPAGTRNHLALDLGIDRNDVVGALDAYDEAVERPMDLGEVNGRVFVNNVSLGLYATIVQSEAYRDAKVETTLEALPKVLGPGTQPFDLRFDGPDGEHHDGAHMIQVSNGTYGRTMRTMASRTSVSDGSLGVVVARHPRRRVGDPVPRRSRGGAPRPLLGLSRLGNARARDRLGRSRRGRPRRGDAVARSPAAVHGPPRRRAAPAVAPGHRALTGGAEAHTPQVPRWPVAGVSGQQPSSMSPSSYA